MPVNKGGCLRFGFGVQLAIIISGGFVKKSVSKVAPAASIIYGAFLGFGGQLVRRWIIFHSLSLHGSRRFQRQSNITQLGKFMETSEVRQKCEMASMFQVCLAKVSRLRLLLLWESLVIAPVPRHVIVL